MSLKKIKSTWNEFLKEAKKGVMLVGSYPIKDRDRMEKVLEEKGADLEFQPNRTYIKGEKQLAFKTERGTTSYLERVGKVFKWQNFFLIEDNHTFTIYMAGGKATSTQSKNDLDKTFDKYRKKFKGGGYKLFDRIKVLKNNIEKFIEEPYDNEYGYDLDVEVIKSDVKPNLTGGYTIDAVVEVTDGDFKIDFILKGEDNEDSSMIKDFHTIAKLYSANKEYPSYVVETIKDDKFVTSKTDKAFWQNVYEIADTLMLLSLPEREKIKRIKNLGKKMLEYKGNSVSGLSVHSILGGE